MSAHFDFAHDGWRTTEARLFAEELSKANSSTRDRVCKQFGLTLTFGADGIQTDYDGRKIGFGSFCNPNGRVTFVISPKVEDFDIKSLFQCIDSLHLFNKIVQIDNGQQADVYEMQEETFSWTFLLGLLEEIRDFGVNNLLIFNSRKTLKGRSSIVGRPIAKSLVKNMALGKFGIDCEVLDNYRQRQYASIFFATAKSIFKDLESWQSVIKRSDINLKSTFNSISAKLKHFSDITFSPSLLREMSNPPYSYGVKSLLFQCQRYWKWKGIFATSNTPSVNTFWSISIALDVAFELYAGHIINRMLDGHIKLPKQKYPYSLPINDSRFSKGLIEREIEPDHIYINQTDNTVLIAEIKYSTYLAIREHIGQLLAYVKYKEFPFFSDRIKGVLVYPGQVYTLQKIQNFDADLYLLTLPAEAKMITTTPVLDLQ